MDFILRKIQKLNYKLFQLEVKRRGMREITIYSGSKHIGSVAIYD